MPARVLLFLSSVQSSMQANSTLPAYTVSARTWGNSDFTERNWTAPRWLWAPQNRVAVAEVGWVSQVCPPKPLVRVSSHTQVMWGWPQVPHSHPEPRASPTPARSAGSGQTQLCVLTRWQRAAQVKPVFCSHNSSSRTPSEASLGAIAGFLQALSTAAHCSAATVRVKGTLFLRLQS